MSMDNGTFTSSRKLVEESKKAPSKSKSKKSSKKSESKPAEAAADEGDAKDEGASES